MAHDPALADRIRETLSGVRGVTEKRMFGGLAFLVNGNMAVAASGRGDLMVRVPPEATETMLTRSHVSPMIMSGRETRGWVRIDLAGVRTARQLQQWVNVGAGYAAELPAK
ncbi:TfoX/Sxy family protein [Mycobacterium sp. M26]|uniref:TfoX/Sxy family protein n=1 Tax=Mycobacterium sp. M26 TaxID=1762962 RepID=UPI00073F8E2C|nr:TfoX/Sxy family protein [Mycobacterium sp. M26]